MDQPARPPARKTARSRVLVPAASGFLFFLALGLSLSIHWAPPYVVFVEAPLAGILAATACELLARADELGLSEEPFRLDGYCLFVAGIAHAVLGFAVGAEAAPVAWLLVAALAAVGANALMLRRPAPAEPRESNQPRSEST